MTNNPTIDGVSREDERHAAVKALHDIMQAVPSASLYSLAEAVLDAGYAPVVERQPDASVNWQVVATEQMSIIEQRQSTIAQLQARVKELESARGEPVAWMTGPIVWGYRADANRHADAHGMTVIPLFTAPPAPVAVVLPERKSASGREWSSHHVAEVEGWNACLDATAALNEVRK